MGNLKYILLVCMMFIITSCEGLFYTDNVGNPIRFGASPGNKGTITRTIYSGTVDGTTERIYWSGDDKVSIYMDWDENRDGTGYTGKPENGIYSVNPGSDFHPGDLRYGRISYANDGEVLKWHGDFKDNNGRANEYPHTFWSAYPPTNLISGKFIFDLPSNQNGSMKYAYMASYEEGVFSNSSGNDGHVELHYYPMITTFCLTIKNDLDEPIEKITLKSDSNYLVGKYSVSVNNRSFGFYDYEGNNSGQVIRNVNIGSDETVKNILFFIIPQNFEANELYFLLNSNETKEYRLPKDIEAYHKYNINITVSKEEPEVDGPFSTFINGVILAEAHKKGLNWQWGDPKKNPPEDPNKIYGPVPTEKGWDEIPSELLWEIINSIVNLDVTGTWEMGDTITPEDLNIFPNLQTVKLSGYYKKVEINNTQITEIDITTSEGDCVFNIHDCTLLEKLNIHKGKSVTVKGNGNLTELNVDSENISDFELDDCDALTTFVVDASPNGNCVKNVKVSNNESLIDFYIKQPTTNDKFYLLAENNDSLTYFEIQQMSGWPPSVDWDAWGLTYRFDIKNCPVFKNYKVSNNAKTW